MVNKRFFKCALITLGCICYISADVCIETGSKHYAAKNYKQTIIALEKCRENASAWEILGNCYFEMKYMEEAKKYLQKASQAQPNNVQIKIKYARALGLNKEFKKSLEEFQKLYTADPKNFEVQKGYAQVLGWNKNYEKAIGIYRTLLKDNPRDFESWIEIGVLTSWNKKFKEAIQEFTMILNANPDTESAMRARLHKAEVLSWQKSFKESEMEYKQLIKEHKSFINAYLGLGTLYEWQSKYKDAKVLYETALQQESQNADVKARLAQLMWVK